MGGQRQDWARVTESDTVSSLLRSEPHSPLFLVVIRDRPAVGRLLRAGQQLRGHVPPAAQTPAPPPSSETLPAHVGPGTEWHLMSPLDPGHRPARSTTVFPSQINTNERTKAPQPPVAPRTHPADSTHPPPTHTRPRVPSPLSPPLTGSLRGSQVPGLAQG